MQDNQNFLVATQDGSFTLFSKKYNQHYHNTQDGSFSEALTKHIIPTFFYHQCKKELNILDICFGIGYNTFSAIYYVLKNSLDIKLNIFSPELDCNLIKSLKDFPYTKEFEEFSIIKDIIETVSQNNFYEDEKIRIEVSCGNARAYIKKFENNFFDIVFQDAFSSDVNFELWTKEYFDDIYRICKSEPILSTYAIATPIRLSLYEAGFFIYEEKATKRKITLAFKNRQKVIGKFINMELKKEKNSTARALYDK